MSCFWSSVIFFEFGSIMVKAWKLLSNPFESLRFPFLSA